MKGNTLPLKTLVRATSTKGLISKLYASIHLAALEKEINLPCRLKWLEDMGELTDKHWNHILESCGFTVISLSLSQKLTQIFTIHRA